MAPIEPEPVLDVVRGLSTVCATAMQGLAPCAASAASSLGSKEARCGLREHWAERKFLPWLQIASFTIVVQQLKTIYDAFFITCCDRCRGTGIVTCPHVGVANGH